MDATRRLSRAGRETKAQNTLAKIYSSLKLSNLVDDLETTNRVAGHAKVADRRIDGVIAAEDQAVRIVAVRRCRPIAATAADMVENAIVVEAITRSRIPDGRCRTKLAGEVHAFVSAVVWVTGKE